MAQLKSQRTPGRPRALRPCPNGCGKVYGAREMLVHLPKCPKRRKKT